MNFLFNHFPNKHSWIEKEWTRNSWKNYFEKKDLKKEKQYLTETRGWWKYHQPEECIDWCLGSQGRLRGKKKGWCSGTMCGRTDNRAHYREKRISHKFRSNEIITINSEVVILLHCCSYERSCIFLCIVTLPRNILIPSLTS